MESLIKGIPNYGLMESQDWIAIPTVWGDIPLKGIGVRGFPLRGYSIPGRDGTWAWTPWRILLGVPPPSSPLEEPTYYQPTYLPTYMPKMKHTWYWLRVSTWIILRKKIWAQYYRQIDRNSDIYLVSMVLSHFEKSHFLKKVSPGSVAHGWFLGNVFS